MSEPLEIKSFSLADDDRVEDKRLPGLCKTILNFVPNLGDGERVRSGYTTYTDVATPQDTDILKVVPIQTPSQEDIHFHFNNFGSQINMYPHWVGATKVSESIDLSEGGLIGGDIFNSSDISYPAANQMNVANWSTYSLNTTADYYNGWVVQNATQSQFSLVTDFSVTANVATFTFYENLFTDIITNSSFETHTGSVDDGSTDTFTGWTNTVAGTGKVESSATANAGSVSVKLTGDGANTAAIAQMITVHQNHTLSFYIRGSGVASARLSLTLTNPSNGKYYDFAGQNWVVGATSKSYNVTTGFVLQSETIELAALQTGYTMSFAALNTGTSVFVDTVAVSLLSLGWVQTDELRFYRHFHDNPGTTLAYNNDKANPPVVKSDNNFIWLCGGQSSATNNHPVKVYPRLTRTFFPATKTFTFDSTYASLRRLYAYDFIGSGSPLNFGAEATNPLPSGKTYWVAVAGVFDGFQLGDLKKYDTYTAYTGGDSSNGYLSTSAWKLNLSLAVSIALLDKRLTGLWVGVATDAGDTRGSGRQNPYRFVKFLPFTDTNFAGWAYTGSTTQKFTITLAIDKLLLDSAGNTYQTDAGIADNSPDIMYSHSTHEIISGRHFLANCYVVSESVIDRQNLYTNPIGANAVIGNAGIPAVDMFSNDASAYVIRTTQGIGSKIQAIRSSDINSMLLWKDKGILFGRVFTSTDGIPDIAWTTISDEVGLTTVDEVARDDEEYHYFPDRNDIYRIRGNNLQRLIERDDKNDWLYTYRNTISQTEKQNATVFWLPYLKGIVFLFGNNRTYNTDGFNYMQYIFFPEGGWRQIRYNESANKSTESFKWMTHLLDGTILGMGTSNATVMKFSSTTFNDNGTAIVPRMDSGYFHPSGTSARDWYHDKIVFSRKYDQPVQGNLDIDVYARETTDDTLVRTFASQDKTYFNLICNGKSDDRRIFNYFRFVYNSNLLTPEKLNQGKLFQINRVLMYGETRPRLIRTNESAALTQGIIMNMGNTIGGKREILITSANTPQTFTWDTPFTGEYTDNNSATVPVYRFVVESAVTLGGSPLAKEDVTIVSKALTTITLQSTSANTVVTFMAG